MSYFKKIQIYDPVTGKTVQVIDDGALRAINQTYLQAVMEGDIANHSFFNKIGYSPASASAQTTLWNPGTEYVFPTGATPVEAVSTSANDDGSPLGTGVQVMHLQYLDINYAEKESFITMNGTTPVAGPTDVFRVNSWHVRDVGSLGKSDGVVSIRMVGGAGTIYSQLPAGATRSRNSIYTVPAGKIVFLQNIIFSASYSTAGKSVRMTLHASISPCTQTISNSGLLFFPYFESMLMDNSIVGNREAPLKFPATVDIKVSVIGETNARCTADISGWIESV